MSERESIGSDSGIEDISEEHSRLYHYTDIGSLENIIKNQTLWAIHYKGLNDSSEVQHMRPIIEEMMLRICNDTMRRNAKNSLLYRRYLDKHGGLAVTSKWQAKNLVRIYYDLTFSAAGSAGEPYAEPYVVSFCSHSDKSTYVQKNGLLSQWRGYGAEGGVAIVFNTERLRRVLGTELQNYDYSAIYLKPVVYHESALQDDEEFKELKEALQQYVKGLDSDDKAMASSGDVFLPFFGCVTRFKHQGFEEESEIRITVSPVPERTQEFATIKSLPAVRLKPTFDRRNRRGVNISRVAINDFPNKGNLPIQQIIVGPQQDQDAVVRRVNKIIGRKKIKVTKSETPYIPMNSS